MNQENDKTLRSISGTEKKCIIDAVEIIKIT